MPPLTTAFPARVRDLHHSQNPRGGFAGPREGREDVPLFEAVAIIGREGEVAPVAALTAPVDEAGKGL